MDKFIDPQIYSQIIEKMPICCVDIVLVKERKVLLVKRKNEPSANEWFIPGGRVHKNESLIEAVRRKAHEELGIGIEIVKLIGTYEYFSDISTFKEVKSGTHSIDTVFLVALKGNEKIKLDETSSEYKWINSIEDSLPKFVKNILKDSGVFTN